MKQILFTLTLLASFSIGLNAQVEFAPVGATWHYEYLPQFGGNAHLEFGKFVVSGDTVVNGKDCRIVDLVTKPTGISQGDRVLLSQEGDKVYYVVDTSFHLLYDFSMEAGDSLWIRYPLEFAMAFPAWGDVPDTFGLFVVDSMWFTEINGQMRKTLYGMTSFENCDFPSCHFEGEFIEGIGNLFWLLPHQIGVDFHDFFGLRCYEDEELGLYKRVEYDCDDPEVPVVMVHVDRASASESFPIRLILSPNPAREQMRLQLEGRIPEACRLEVSNLAGKVFYQAPLAASRGEALHLSVAEWPGGLYVLQVWGPAGELLGVEKAVVVR